MRSISRADRNRGPRSPEEALAIGDAHLDVMAAQAAGIRHVVLVGSPQWMKEHIPANADFLEAKDLHEAAEIIGRLLSG